MTKEMKDSLVQMITAEVVRRMKLQDQPLVAAKAEAQPEPMLTDAIITARKLEGLSVVTVGIESIITPSAKDYIREKKIQFQRSLKNPDTGCKPECNRYHFWSACSMVTSFDSAVPGIQVEPMIQQPKIDVIESVLGKIDSEIKNATSKGGIIVVESSPKALFATRNFSSLRPIVGSCARTVEDGVSQIGANLLILETAYLGKVSVLQLAELFVSLEGTLKN